MRDRKKVIGNAVGTTLNPAMVGGGGGSGEGSTMVISASKPFATNCVWFNTSGVMPTGGDDTESAVIAEANGVTI